MSDQQQNPSQASQQPPAPKPAPAPSSAPFDKKDMVDNKLMVVIGYVGILFLVPLLAARQSRYAQFHAKQSLILFAAELVLGVVPFLGWTLALVPFVVSVIAIVKTLQDESWEIPYVAEYAKKINI